MVKYLVIQLIRRKLAKVFKRDKVINNDYKFKDFRL